MTVNKNQKMSQKWLAILIIGALALPAGYLLFPRENPIMRQRLKEKQKAFAEKQREYQKIKREKEFIQRANQDLYFEMTLKNLKMLRGRLGLFYLLNERQPTQKEVRSALSPIPENFFSRSAKIHFKRNHEGGWYYDGRYGNIAINSDKKIGKFKLEDF